MEVRVSLPLRDFYNGRKTEFTIEKQAICSACEGSGSEDGHVETCGTCGGRGVRIQRQQLAPGLFQQVQMHCDQCHGKGKTIKHPCPVCSGSRVIREAETHTLEIEKGMPKGVRVTYENEADESPDYVLVGDAYTSLRRSLQWENKSTSAQTELSSGDEVKISSGAKFFPFVRHGWVVGHVT